MLAEAGVQAGGAFELEDWKVIEAGGGVIGRLEQFPLTSAPPATSDVLFAKEVHASTF